MKGFRFYLEFENTYKKRKKQHCGNCIAIVLDDSNRPLYGSGNNLDCIAAAYYNPNCPPCSCSVSIDYLRSRCKRIKESEARAIHPELFRYIEQ